MGKVIPDISHWHPVRDWFAMATATDVIISKATQGTAYIDPTLDDFIEGCEIHGLKYWLFAYLDKGKELSQTKFLVKVCKNRVGEHFAGYALDVEADNAVASVRNALAWLKKQGKPTMIYFGHSDYAKYKPIIDKRGDTKWWEARYGRDNGKVNLAYPCHDGVQLWQYTSNGVFPGFGGDLVDLNQVQEEPFINAPEDDGKTGEAYSGAFPVFPDGRDCYKQGDGITRLTEYPTQIKRVQMLLNWITGESLVIDGKYGAITKAVCIKAQDVIGAKPDGIFGTQTLRFSKSYRKHVG